MKPKYLSLIAGILTGIASLSHASPNELYAKMTSEIKPTRTDYTSITGTSTNSNFTDSYTNSISSPQGFNMALESVNRGRLDKVGKAVIENKDLEFRLQDDSTKIEIIDKNADGPSEGDKFILTHNFKDNSQISICIGRVKNSGGYVYGDIYTTAGIKKSFDIDTENMNPLAKRIAARKMQPFMKFSDELYQKMINSALAGETTKLPYALFKQTLDEIGQYIKTMTADDSGIEAGIKISNSLLSSIKDN
ncbi:MAG: hypothetical protein AABX17_00280 [Nanoarchaeota archaeon]